VKLVTLVLCGRRLRIMLLWKVRGVLLLILAALSLAAASTDRPIIGIWAESSDRLPPPCNGACEMIAASYVKWIESAGGRAVAVPYNATIAQVQSASRSTATSRSSELVVEGHRC
jgi:hypothetical protein